MTAMLVLGGGIVGSAAAWDLVRRGHRVTVADRDDDAAERAESVGAGFATIDVTDGDALRRLIDGHAATIAAVPYRLGVEVAEAAIDAGSHHLDFGGNPAIVRRQLELDPAAVEAGVGVIPDCGLAPGVANVMAEELIARLDGDGIDQVQMRVGALPRRPSGELGYQLAFNPAGLINEYAEPCEILEGGRHVTVDPLDRFEEVAWEGWGPLEAFSTAGGTSLMCVDHAGRIDELEYKTLRFPGHGRVFRAMLELGLFAEEERSLPGIETAPRATLLAALGANLPVGEPDVVLVRVWATKGVSTVGWELVDQPDGGFSALARTTAFPATALAHLMVTGEAETTGVRTMHQAAPPRPLLAALEEVDLVTRPWAPPSG